VCPWTSAQWGGKVSTSGSRWKRGTTAGWRLTSVAEAHELTGNEGVGSSGQGAALEFGKTPGSVRGEREAVRGSAHGEQQWWKQRNATRLTSGSKVGWRRRNEWEGSSFIAVHCMGATRAYVRRERES
jgi:hypothetical protein